ncbi:MAG: alpha/beta hydrolase-fold protein [Anaerolineales bacterium]
MSKPLDPARLLARLEKNGNPLIEADAAMFVWKGTAAPHLICDLYDWEENPRPLRRLTDDLYALRLPLPADTYLEYAFFDPATGQRVRDPFNPRRIWNGVGQYNHYVYMPAAAPSPLTRRDPAARRGEVTRHEIPADDLTAGRKRLVHLYQPPTDDPVPLLVVYDGNDYLRRGRITVIVDNLIAQRRIRPLALALVPNGGPTRMVEYACSEATLGFILQTVLPLARRQMRLVDPARQPGAYGVLGASMGGLMAVYTALRLPHIFGRVISQAGAFELGDYETVVVQMVRHLPPPPVQFWLDVGRMDFLRQANRRMAALLEERGYSLTYLETGGAHNYTTWRNVLGEALTALFG